MGMKLKQVENNFDCKLILDVLPPNKWAHRDTPGFSGWCKVQIQPKKKELIKELLSELKIGNFKSLI